MYSMTVESDRYCLALFLRESQRTPRTARKNHFAVVT